MTNTKQIFTFTVFLITFTSIAFSEPGISILWEKEIGQADRTNKPYAIKVAEDGNVVRIVGVSYTPRTKGSSEARVTELFEYRVNLKDEKSELKTIMSMGEGDITVRNPLIGIKDSQLIGNDIVIIRDQYKSCNLQELIVGNNRQVKTREIPGLTRGDVSTHGACVNKNGDVFLCGNSGYIRKVKNDGSVAWDTNYKSDKKEDGTFSVAFSESDKLLVAFGFSFTPDTKFTTKDSSLWLANLDSDGNFKAKIGFEGIANFGKFFAFCLSKSGVPTVIYDTNPEIRNCKICVSKFSKDLSAKNWTTPIFDGTEMMLSQLSLTPFGDDYTLAAFHSGSLVNNSNNLHFYVLDKNGNIVNQAIFKDIKSVGYLVTVFKDRIFLVTNEFRTEKDKAKEFSRLICFKIKNGQL